jgi:RNA polymerase sigma factor (sigma-70 family)
MTSKVLQQLRTALLRQGAGSLSDGQLLEYFLAQRDEAAFEALVRRHGPMVLGVCRRIIGNVHDAEDAFQATFLVFVRKAASLRQRELLGNWLYGVAYRTAMKSRALNRRAARRADAVGRQVVDKLERVMSQDQLDPVDLWQELQPLLDQELNRLPDKYRVPVVLCELEGQARKAVAQQLGIPEGTLSSRLATARKMLAQRLTRRGVTLSAGSLAMLLSQSAASASVPPSLLTATVKAASLLAAGPVAAGLISAKVAALTQGVMKAMLLSKHKIAVAAVLGAGVITTGVSGLIYRTQAQAVLPKAPAQESPQQPLVVPAPREKPAEVTRPQSAAQPAGPGTLLLARQGELIALTPEGKEGNELPAPKGIRFGLQGRLSPDGTRAAYVVAADGPLRPPPRVGEADEPWPFKVVICKLAAAAPTVLVDLPAHGLTLTWAPDGKRLLVTLETGAPPQQPSFETVLLDPETGETKPFRLPAGVRVLDWSPDGKTLLVVHRQDKKCRLGLTAEGEQGVRNLTELKGRAGDNVGRFSPDGRRVLYTDADPADQHANKWGVSSKPYLLDVAAKKPEPLSDFPQNGQAVGVAWSPDGKRVAYTWKQLHADLLQKDTLTVNDVMVVTEAFLVVADADGKNARTVSSAKGDSAINAILGSIDWR